MLPAAALTALLVASNARRAVHQHYAAIHHHRPHFLIRMQSNAPKHSFIKPLISKEGPWLWS